MLEVSCRVARSLRAKLQPLFWLKNVLPVTVFLLILGCGLYFIEQHHALRNHDKQMGAQQILVNQESELSRRLSFMLSSTYFLAQEVASSNGNFTRFDSYAANLLQRMDGISNLQLAPNGVIKQIFPLEGSEKAIGHNILVDDKRKDEAAQAIRDRKITLAGPFELVQGGIAVIGRNPVFLVQPDGREKFWGFTSALILLEDLLGGGGLNTLIEAEYIYELSRQDPATGTKSVFASNGDSEGIEMQSIDISVPNGFWTLQIGLPEDGEEFRRFLQQLAVFIIATFLAAITRRIANEPETLRQKVAKQTRELHRLAYFDGLTGLPNRHHFNESLTTALNQSAKKGNRLTLLLMDLDRFKEVNDTLGHDMGDILLREAGTRILKILPDDAMLARLGGDEFTVIINTPDHDATMEQISRDIIETIEEVFVLQNNKVYVSASIGIASTSTMDTSPRELLKCADQAMYEVKRRGRGGFVHYSESIHQQITHRSTLANELRKAVYLGELQLLYQPIVELASGKVNKAEALLRWNHPTQGTISPAVFIPLAEEIGLINELGDWVLDEVIKMSHYWRMSHNKQFQISINVSPMQFLSGDHIPQWIAKINGAGLNPESILVEITEGVLMENDHNNMELLSSLREAGIQIALDDFGTGYSSLSYLKILDIDYLKIDRAFVQNLTAASKDYVLCQTILSVAHNFGYKVVAEGVETIEQEKLLSDIGCHYSQGFLYSKPIPAEDFEQLFFDSIHKGTQPDCAA